MPKKLNYPSASFKNALEVASAVYELKSCKIETCAEKLNKKPSGAFNYLINGAIKYNLIVRKKGDLIPTDLFKQIQTAYNEDEKRECLKKAFLSVPLFSVIYEKYKDDTIPLSILEKMLIKEYEVNNDDAGKIAGYFKNGGILIGLFDSNGKINQNEPVRGKSIDTAQPDNENPIGNATNDNNVSIHKYAVVLSGPDGYKMSFVLEEDSDFEALNALIAQVRKKLNK